VLANAQHARGFVALLDADHAADFEQLRRCGVDLADLLLVVPEGAREALDIAGLLVASGGLDALVLAAANSLVSGPFGDRRAFAAGLRRLLVELAPSPTAVVVLVHRDAAWRADGNAARQLAYPAALRRAVLGDGASPGSPA
jgi:recombination protein RecA